MFISFWSVAAVNKIAPAHELFGRATFCIHTLDYTQYKLDENFCYRASVFSMLSPPNKSILCLSCWLLWVLCVFFFYLRFYMRTLSLRSHTRLRTISHNLHVSFSFIANTGTKHVQWTLLTFVESESFVVELLSLVSYLFGRLCVHDNSRYDEKNVNKCHRIAQSNTVVPFVFRIDFDEHLNAIVCPSEFKVHHKNKISRWKLLNSQNKTLKLIRFYWKITRL